MSNRLGGKQGTAYLGTNANQPPNWTFSDRDPNQYDIYNISLGDMWLNQDSEDVWILVSLAGSSESKGSLATWKKIGSSNESLPIAFITTVGTTIDNVTGNGASYTVVYDNVISDTNNAYDNTTGMYTIPLTGYYQFNASVCAQGLTAANDYEIRIICSNGQQLEGSYLHAGAVSVGGYFNGTTAGIISATTGDQVFVEFISTGGVSNDIDVFNVYSFFNGFKLG